MKDKVVQIACAVILSIPSGMSGIFSVWPSYAIGMLKNDDSPLGYKITQNEGSLISSIPMLGCFISTLLAGLVAETLGRKKSLLLSGLGFVLSWSLVVTSRSTIQVVLGRFFCGLSGGLASVLTFIALGEITHLSLRGSTSSTVLLMYNFGLLASYLQGWFCSYEVICYGNLTTAVFFVLLMSFLKETPPYLLKMGKEMEALESLKFYRGASETTNAILEEFLYMKSHANQNRLKSPDAEKLTDSVKEKLQYEEENSTNKNPWILLFTIPHNRRAVINSITFIILTVCMGMIAVQAYASQFFTTAAPSLSPDGCSVLLAGVMILTSMLTVAVTDMLPRRTLMILTCAVATVCLAALGATLRWPVGPAWVAPLLIMIYCVTFALGVMNIVFVQLSESYGPQVHSVATAITLASMFAANFLVLYLFEPSVESFGIDGTFFLFAIISAVTTVMAILFLKETRRVPLEDVQRMHADGFLYKRISNVVK